MVVVESAWSQPARSRSRYEANRWVCKDIAGAATADNKIKPNRLQMTWVSDLQGSPLS